MTVDEQILDETLLRQIELIEYAQGLGIRAAEELEQSDADVIAALTVSAVALLAMDPASGAARQARNSLFAKITRIREPASSSLIIRWDFGSNPCSIRFWDISIFP